MTILQYARTRAEAIPELHIAPLPKCGNVDIYWIRREVERITTALHVPLQGLEQIQQVFDAYIQNQSLSFLIALQNVSTPLPSLAGFVISPPSPNPNIRSVSILLDPRSHTTFILSRLIGSIYETTLNPITQIAIQNIWGAPDNFEKTWKTIEHPMIDWACLQNPSTHIFGNICQDMVRKILTCAPLSTPPPLLIAPIESRFSPITLPKCRFSWQGNTYKISTHMSFPLFRTITHFANGSSNQLYLMYRIPSDILLYFARLPHGNIGEISRHIPNFNTIFEAMKKAEHLVFRKQTITSPQAAIQEQTCLQRIQSVNPLPPYFPKIVDIQIYHTSKGRRMAVIMPYYTNGTFFDKAIRLPMPLSIRELEDLLNDIVQMCQSITHLHFLGMVHKDIKLENFILDAKRKLRLIDFGFSCLNEQMDLSSCGSPAYAAPEVLQGKESISSKSDIWSLGMTIFYTLNPFFSMNYDPWHKALMRNMKQETPSYVQYHLREIPRPRYPNSLTRLINFMIQEDPQNRPDMPYVLAEVTRIRDHFTSCKNIPQ